MKKIIINENQKGFLFKNGKFVKLLSAGRYWQFGDRVIEVVNLSSPIFSLRCGVETLLEYPEVKACASVAEVSDRQIALHFVNGKFERVLPCGKYGFWAEQDRHTYQWADITSPEVDPAVPAYVFSKIPAIYFKKVEVAPYQKARLCFDQVFQRILEPGTYYFWENGTKIDVEYVDTRLTKLEIAGQEILTGDKVAVRINFVCNYRISDCAKILTEIDDFSDQLRTVAQLALRDFVGKCRLDDLLDGKDALSRFVYDRLKEREASLFVTVCDVGVKDIILPGEIRTIMNTVLVAEKQAQANVISRREEVASTRSLLNTARLMEENKTLYKLKELEYVEKICENVGNINLNGGGNILAQLTDLFKGAAP